MDAQRSIQLVVAAIVTCALALMPMTAMAADDQPGADTGVDDAVAAADADQEVTLDDMTVDSDTNTSDTDQQTTFAQRDGDAGNPGLAQTIGLNALWGGIAGGVIGLGVFLLTGMDVSPWVIAQFAGGGIIVGGTIGLISGLATAEPDPGTRAEQLPDSVDYVRQHTPESLDLPVINTRF